MDFILDGGSLTKPKLNGHFNGMKPNWTARLAFFSRRDFLHQIALLAGTGGAGWLQLNVAKAAPAANEILRAAIIGHTGRGDYGHGLDVLFNDLPGVQVVAIADPVAAGREAAAKRCGALRQYADYREMLAKEKPQLVSIAPRWSDQHHAVAM